MSDDVPKNVLRNCRFFRWAKPNPLRRPSTGVRRVGLCVIACELCAGLRVRPLIPVRPRHICHAVLLSFFRRTLLSRWAKSIQNRLSDFLTVKTYRRFRNDPVQYVSHVCGRFFCCCFFARNWPKKANLLLYFFAAGLFLTCTHNPITG